MDKGVTYLAEPSQCHYLPDREWRLEYRIIPGLDMPYYWELVNKGWRRFGWTLFRPRCLGCQECQPLRVKVDLYQPDRSQRRVQKANAATKLVRGQPRVDSERLDIYFRHHQYHADTKGWTPPNLEDAIGHITSIIEGPFPVEEWAYYVDDKLVAISYIDVLIDGFSGIYFYHDPDYRKMSLGTWICLSLIEEAARQNLPYIYLGYYIKDCRSMAYKGKFLPNQVLKNGNQWEDYMA
jgi:arginyl-tRNA--protein-N-Asp/Glu arginylyltransferase